MSVTSSDITPFGSEHRDLRHLSTLSGFGRYHILWKWNMDLRHLSTLSGFGRCKSSVNYKRVNVNIYQLKNFKINFINRFFSSDISDIYKYCKISGKSLAPFSRSSYIYDTLAICNIFRYLFLILYGKCQFSKYSRSHTKLLI